MSLVLGLAVGLVTGLVVGMEKGLLAVTYLSCGWSPPVLSALGSFTAVFGMGTGGTTPL